MSTLTLTDAISVARRKRPWTFRLELVDPNTNTSKFWYATGRGQNEAVECGWGRIGSKPQTKLVTWDQLCAKVAEKLAKGYKYTNTDYFRMTPESLAKLGGAKPSAPPTGIGVSDHIAPPAAPPAAPPTVPAAPAAPPTVPAAPTPLNGPFALIAALYPVKNGFEGLDSKGCAIMTLGFSGGQEIHRDYGIPITFVK